MIGFTFGNRQAKILDTAFAFAAAGTVVKTVATSETLIGSRVDPE